MIPRIQSMNVRRWVKQDDAEEGSSTKRSRKTKVFNAVFFGGMPEKPGVLDINIRCLRCEVKTKKMVKVLKVFPEVFH